MGNTEIVQELLEAGADVMLMDDNGSSPLHIAAIDGKHKTMELLLDQKANVDCRVASVAAEVGNLTALELLLKRGILINGIDESSQATLFDTAIANNHDDIARFLVMNGCFQSGEATTTPRRLQPRTMAAETGKHMNMATFFRDVDAIKRLLQDKSGTATYQADIDESLRIAAACGFTNVATLLL